MAFFELAKPEVTTIVRWLLRVVLVLFLAWLVRKRPEEEEEGEDEGQACEGRRHPNAKPRSASGGIREPRNSGGRTSQQQQQSAQYGGGGSREQHQRPQSREYPNANLRQRQPQRVMGQDGSLDFDAVIEKISKPQEMWSVRKERGPPQIFSKRPSDKDRAQQQNQQQPSQQQQPQQQTPQQQQQQQPSQQQFTQQQPAHQQSTQQPTQPQDDTPEASRVAPGKPHGPSAAAKAAAREAREKEAARTLHGHERPVTFITWNRDCNLLFTCGKDKIVTVWSFPEGECLGVYHGHNGAVWACSVTADSRWLVTSGADRLVIVWEARTSRELARVELPGVVRFVEWANAGSTNGSDTPAIEKFVTCHNRFGSQPAALMVWSFDGTSIVEMLRITTLPTPASQVKWGRDDSVLASCHDNGEVIFWNADTGAESSRLQAHTGAISKFDFSSDHEVVATASLDKHVKVWDLGTGSEATLLYSVQTDRPLNAVALGPFCRSSLVQPAGNRATCCAVIAAGGQDARDVAKSSGDSEQFGTLMFKLGLGDEFPCELQADGTTKGHFGPVHTLAFATDGTAIASGSEDGCVRFHVFETPAVAASVGAAAEAVGTRGES